MADRTSFLLENAPNGPLRGDVYLPAAPRGAPVVVACHGFKGFKNWGFWPETGRRLTEAGLVLVTFNFSGSGIGEDPEQFTEFDRFQANTVGREVQDLGVILDGVSNRTLPVGDADVRKLGVLGHSRGGGVALVRAGRDPRIRAVVTWAAVARFLSLDEPGRAAWREAGYQEVVNARTGQVFRMGVEFLDDLETHADAYDPIQAVRRIQVPTLILHGTQDDAVPVEAARQLARAAAPGRAKLALIQGAGHTFGAAHPWAGSNPDLDGVLEKTAAWFRDSLA